MVLNIKYKMTIIIPVFNEFDNLDRIEATFLDYLSKGKTKSQVLFIDDGSTDGSSSLARETQFEKDLNWEKYLIDMNNDNEVQYLEQIIKEPTVLLVYKKSLPENLEWLLSYYKNTEIMEKWTIYY